MNNAIYDNLARYYPFIARDAIHIQEFSNYAVICYMDDGSKIFYDDIAKSFRNLPPNADELSEEECRNEFGIRLYKLMAHKGITQEELARRTGIHQVSLSRYITGKTTPSFYMVDKIAKALGCSTDEFRYV